MSTQKILATTIEHGVKERFNQALHDHALNEQENGFDFSMEDFRDDLDKIRDACIDLYRADLLEEEEYAFLTEKVIPFFEKQAIYIGGDNYY